MHACRYFSSDERGLRSVLQLCHLMISQPTWSAGGFERAKTTILSNSRAVMKSMERANHDKILQAVFGGDRRCAPLPSRAVCPAFVPSNSRRAFCACFQVSMHVENSQGR
jgi:hypothetical protein